MHESAAAAGACACTDAARRLRDGESSAFLDHAAAARDLEGLHRGRTRRLRAAAVEAMRMVLMSFMIYTCMAHRFSKQ